MDFYWHYSSKDTIDPAGKDSFCRAITVAAQIFCSLSEYIQVSADNQIEQQILKVKINILSMVSLTPRGKRSFSIRAAGLK